MVHIRVHVLMKTDLSPLFIEFGLYVDQHGMPSRGIQGVIEWEGIAEHVALHPPYVLVFATNFIEIRHASTGRLVQIVPGNDVCCSWDGRNNAATRVTTAMDPEPIPQEFHIHAVMNVMTLSARSQSLRWSRVPHVYCLKPIIALDAQEITPTITSPVVNGEKDPPESDEKNVHGIPLPDTMSSSTSQKVSSCLSYISS